MLDTTARKAFTASKSPSILSLSSLAKSQALSAASLPESDHADPLDFEISHIAGKNTQVDYRQAKTYTYSERPAKHVEEHIHQKNISFASSKFSRLRNSNYSPEPSTTKTVERNGSTAEQSTLEKNNQLGDAAHEPINDSSRAPFQETTVISKQAGEQPKSDFRALGSRDTFSSAEADIIDKYNNAEPPSDRAGTYPNRNPNQGTHPISIHRGTWSYQSDAVNTNKNPSQPIPPRTTEIDSKADLVRSSSSLLVNYNKSVPEEIRTAFEKVQHVLNKQAEAIRTQAEKIRGLEAQREKERWGSVEDTLAAKVVQAGHNFVQEFRTLERDEVGLMIQKRAESRETRPFRQDVDDNESWDECLKVAGGLEDEDGVQQERDLITRQNQDKSITPDRNGDTILHRSNKKPSNFSRSQSSLHLLETEDSYARDLNIHTKLSDMESRLVELEIYNDTFQTHRRNSSPNRIASEMEETKDHAIQTGISTGDKLDEKISEIVERQISKVLENLRHDSNLRTRNLTEQLELAIQQIESLTGNFTKLTADQFGPEHLGVKFRDIYDMMESKVDLSVLDNVKRQLAYIQTLLEGKANCSALDHLKVMIDGKADQLTMESLKMEVDMKADQLVVETVKRRLTELESGDNAENFGFGEKEKSEQILIDDLVQQLRDQQTVLNGKADISSFENLKNAVEAKLGQNDTRSMLHRLSTVEISLEEKSDRSVTENILQELSELQTRLRTKPDLAVVENYLSQELSPLRADIKKKVDRSLFDNLEHELTGLQLIMETKADHSIMLNISNELALLLSLMDDKADRAGIENLEHQLTILQDDLKCRADLPSIEELTRRVHILMEGDLESKADEESLQNLSRRMTELYSTLSGKAECSDIANLTRQYTSMQSMIQEKAEQIAVEMLRKDLTNLQTTTQGQENTLIDERLDHLEQMCKSIERKADQSTVDNLTHELTTSLEGVINGVEETSKKVRKTSGKVTEIESQLEILTAALETKQDKSVKPMDQPKFADGNQISVTKLNDLEAALLRKMDRDDPAVEEMCHRLTEEAFLKAGKKQEETQDYVRRELRQMEDRVRKILAEKAGRDDVTASLIDLQEMMMKSKTEPSASSTPAFPHLTSHQSSSSGFLVDDDVSAVIDSEMAISELRGQINELKKTVRELLDKDEQRLLNNAQAVIEEQIFGKVESQTTILKRAIDTLRSEMQTHERDCTRTLADHLAQQRHNIAGQVDYMAILQTPTATFLIQKIVSSIVGEHFLKVEDIINRKADQAVLEDLMPHLVNRKDMLQAVEEQTERLNALEHRMLMRINSKSMDNFPTRSHGFNEDRGILEEMLSDMTTSDPLPHWVNTLMALLSRRIVQPSLQELSQNHEGRWSSWKEECFQNVRSIAFDMFNARLNDIIPQAVKENVYQLSEQLKSDIVQSAHQCAEEAAAKEWRRCARRAVAAGKIFVGHSQSANESRSYGRGEIGKKYRTRKSHGVRGKAFPSRKPQGFGKDARRRPNTEIEDIFGLNVEGSSVPDTPSERTADDESSTGNQAHDHYNSSERSDEEHETRSRTNSGRYAMVTHRNDEDADAVSDLQVAIRRISRDMDDKLFLLATELSNCKALMTEYSRAPSLRRGHWLWKSNTLRLGSSIPWNLEADNTDPDNFKWRPDSPRIRVREAGLYEVTFSFFTRSRPNVQLLINDEPVLSAINASSYVVRHGSGLVHDTTAGKVREGTVTGLSLLEFLALPAGANVGVLYHGKVTGMDVEGFLGLRKLF